MIWINISEKKASAVIAEGSGANRQPEFFTTEDTEGAEVSEFKRLSYPVRDLRRREAKTLMQASAPANNGKAAGRGTAAA